MSYSCSDKYPYEPEVSDILRLRQRELSPRLKNVSKSIGFSVNHIKSFTKLKSDIKHRGCINTVTWNTDGTKLVTGSDDRTVKIWDTSKSFQDIQLIETIRKFFTYLHYSNLFLYYNIM